MPTTEDLHDRIEHDYTNHPPEDPQVVEIFEEIRYAAKEFAHTVVDLVPQSREQSLALTLINQGLNEAIGGVARNQGAALKMAREGELI